jgi:hypothetical protein
MHSLQKKLGYLFAGSLLIVAQGCNGSGGEAGAASSANTVAATATSPSTTTETGTGTGAATVTAAQKHFFMIVLENTDAATALQQPFLSQLASKGVLLSNYSAITHPSQPNYIALTSGNTWGVTDDNNHTVNAKNIVDLIEEQGLSWKSYEEDYSGGCDLSAQIGNYVRKHDPLISYTDVQSDATRCAKIVNATQLATDVAANALPNFSFYSPNLQNDGHDTDVTFADNWLSATFSSLLQNPNFTNNTLFVVTFDEGANNSAVNQVYTVLYGDMVQAGVKSSQAVNHYSLLAMVEQYLGLGSLGQNDASAQAITGIWK